MDYILPVGYALLLGGLFYRFHPLRSEGYGGWLVAGGYLYKLLLGVALWYIYSAVYTHRETSDIFRFFDDARVMYSALPEDPGAFFRMLTSIHGTGEDLEPYYRTMNNWYKQHNYFLYNDARTLIRVNAFILLFSFGSYHVHTVFMSAFAYLGSLYLVKAFYRFAPQWKMALFAAVLLVPSVAFWSAGVLKEGIFMAGFGMFIYQLLQLMYGRPGWKGMIWLVLSAGLLLLIKVYLFLCLLPGILFLVSGRWLLRNRPLLRFGLVHISWFGFLVAFPTLFPRYHIFYILFKKRLDFIHEAQIWSAGSLVSTPDLQPNAWSFLKQVPFALEMVFLRPFIWEASSTLMLFSSLENLALVLCLLLPVIAFRKPGIREWNVLLFCISFTWYLYVLIGTITPILGSLVRYKIPGIPLLLVAVLILTDKEKLLRRLRIQR